MDKDLAFVEWVETELSDRGWSRSQLAHRAGVTPTAISDLLNGRRSAGIDLCKAIAKAFRLPPEFVLRKAGHLPPAKGRSRLEDIHNALFAGLNEENRRKALEYMQFLKVSEEKGEYNVDDKNAQSPRKVTSES